MDQTYVWYSFLIDIVVTFVKHLTIPLIQKFTANIPNDKSCFKLL
jgi:hypothetical protein